MNHEFCEHSLCARKQNACAGLQPLAWHIFLVVALFSSMSASAQTQSVTYIWDYDFFVEMKKNTEYFKGLRSRIFKYADEAAANGPLSVMQKKRCVSGDYHNFESFATYFWPNSDDPDGPYIGKDGVANPILNDYDHPLILSMSKNVKYLALAYFLSEDKAYLDAYKKQIRTWFIDKRTRMYPQMEYAGFAPGHYNNKGMEGGYIEARYLHDVLESLRLVNHLTDLGSLNTDMQKWFSDFFEWSQTSSTGNLVNKYANNQAVNYDFVRYDILLFLGNESGRRQIWDGFYENRVKPQIKEDGRQPQELSRATPFQYSVFNLILMTDFCLAAKRDGLVDVSPVRERIERALLYLTPYIGREKSFPYTDISTDFTATEIDLKETVIRIKSVTSTTAFDDVDLKGIYNFGIND